MRKRFDELSRKLVSKQCEINTIKENNRKYDEFKQKYDDIVQVNTELETYLNALNLILQVAKREDNDFKEKRLSFVQDGIGEDLDFLFPNEDITPKLKYSTVRGKRKATLVLVDKNGYERTPKNSASGLMQQIISFTGSVSTARLLGSNKALIDEAFGAASTENKGKVGQIINEFVNKGTQLILISQSCELYQDLPRREIKLEKKNDKVVVTGVEDFGGDLNE